MSAFSYSAFVLHVLQLCKTCMTDHSVLFSAPTQLWNFQFCVNLATTHSRGPPSPCRAPFLALPNRSRSSSSPPCPLFSFVPTKSIKNYTQSESSQPRAPFLVLATNCNQSPPSPPCSLFSFVPTKSIEKLHPVRVLPSPHAPFLVLSHEGKTHKHWDPKCSNTPPF